MRFRWVEFRPDASDLVPVENEELVLLAPYIVDVSQNEGVISCFPRILNRLNHFSITVTTKVVDNSRIFHLKMDRISVHARVLLGNIGSIGEENCSF
jgi:hypothetical protein